MSDDSQTAKRTGTRRSNDASRPHASRVGPALLAASAAAVCLLAPPSVASAAPCPDEGAREAQVHGLALPDCRSFEQVSPVDTNEVSAAGFPGSVQASPSGDRVRYYSLVPFAGGEGPGGGFPVYVSSRVGLREWETEDVIPSGTEKASALGYSEDLSRAVVWTEGPPQGKRNFSVRETGSGAERFLVGGFEDFYQFPAVAGFSADGSQLVFESEANLLPGQSREGVVNAYEVNLGKLPAEQLSLVGVLPAGEGGVAPPGGSVAGEGVQVWPSFPAPPRPNSAIYTQTAVSADGSRVVFTALPSQHVYVRENAGAPASPVNGSGECEVAADACTVPVSEGAAHFYEMTPSGAFVLYTERGALYRFDVATGARVDLSTGSATPGVLGVLGLSADGSSVYFAAEGVLASNENEHGQKAVEGRKQPHSEETEVANLYEWHPRAGGEPVLTFIASAANFLPDVRDWSDQLGGSAPGLQKRARVSPDGSTLLFSSIVSLTGYSDGGPCQNGACSELFRYRAGPEGGVGSLNCVSCDPSGASPAGEALLEGAIGQNSGPIQERTLTRNLSANGNRVFFQTPDALLPGDGNKQTDVYEWEADGEGSCRSESQDHGCLYLISSGTSPQTSYFADASANGNSVFFFSAQNLTGADSDSNVHVFAARVCEKGEPCEEPEGAKSGEPTPCSGEGCLGPAPSPPALPAPASSLLTATGNLTPLAPALGGSSKPPSKTLTNKQKLAKALKACRKKRPAHTRALCEKAARKAYGTKASAKKSPRKAHR